MDNDWHIPHVLLLVETAGAYGRGLSLGIGRYIAQHGPWSTCVAERAIYERLPTWLNDWRGDGILACSLYPRDVERLQATGLPVVELVADPQLGLPCVHAESERMGEMAAEHLLGLGLEQFAFFAPEHHWWAVRRRDGFLSKLAQNDRPCSIYVPPTRQGRQKWQNVQQSRILDWLKSLPARCGVFSPSDRYAVALLDLCRRAKIAVPEQLAVVGVDNDPVLSSLSYPPLSSVDPHSARCGYEGAALLARLMAGEAPVEKVIWTEPGGVVARQSTDVLAVDDAEVALAVRFIREHACEGISVEDVAEVVAFSRRTLERRFHETFQRTLKQEILRLQIERARTLLRQSDMSIELVCRSCGFEWFKYFARVFRREVGMTPRRFRQVSRVPGTDTSSP